MTEAWISASAGRAVVAGESGLVLIEAGTREPRHVPKLHPHLALSLAADAFRVVAGSHPFAGVAEELERCWEEDRALTLLLIAIDPVLSHATRASAANVLSGLLLSEAVSTGVRIRFLAAPLPSDIMIDHVEGKALALVREAEESRAAVEAVTTGWNEASFTASLPEEDASTLRARCVLLGGFDALVSTVKSGDSKPFEIWRVRVAAEDPLLGEMHAETFLDSWYTGATSFQGTPHQPAHSESSTVPPLPMMLLTWTPSRRLGTKVLLVARSNASILITGETGVGKEMAARLIHQTSQRAKNPFVAINCAGVPDSLLESEIFGHVSGSFPDAYRDKRGLLEQAQSGTIFMNEVGEMSPRMQARLLRFLENGEIQRAGSERVSSTVDVRVIAATSRNLLERMVKKPFREDLYCGLRIHVAIPPLRERKEDILRLFDHFLQEYGKRHRVDPPRLLDETMARLVAYDWPGNVRELKNAAERLVVRTRSGVITPEDLPREIRQRIAQPSPTSAGGPPGRLSKGQAGGNARRRSEGDDDATNR
jgi:transcriptional regulator with AAA-type ATPase domain